MLIEDYGITVKDNNSSFLNWTAENPGDVSWVFINGRHKYGPLYFDNSFRSIEIPFKPSDILKIDIHDFFDNSITLK